ncbi:MAG: 2-hydroxyacyl-CoA dehydratase family protein [Syntrophomonadaceae bacterium]|jgi:benzoyl-CoA reductase/2-hydroxyglutaryl-CoA dehydratase subunit BcrC/BadD/HgdB|nr:2-hydroxyacyl-CoA dehydratase family protein [Syntrophomonadaceae bacterium]
MNQIAFTSTVPVEIIIAAHKIPVDLNNVFISMERPQDLVAMAETAGYPRTTCGWIKGIYATALSHKPEGLIAVMEGDCSNTQALMETLKIKGITTIPFAYPFDRDPESMELQIRKLCSYFGVELAQAEKVKKELDEIRVLCGELDRLTWQENVVSGEENHLFLVSSSDFNGNASEYAKKLGTFLEKARRRTACPEPVRLAYIGVPPIFTDLYETLSSLGARVVYNEVQRQFSMPFNTANLTEQYLAYTYPYGAFARLEDIKKETAIRKVDGIIHYTQSFCYRQIEDLIYRDQLKLPFITLEGDQPGLLDARSRMRLEAFISMLK